MAESSSNLVPSTRKVTVGSLAGALVAIIVALVGWSDVPPGVESALGTVVAALIFFFVPEAYVNKIPTG